MKLTNVYRRVPCSDVIVHRDERQRKVIKTEDLEPSIARRGVLQPIIIDREMVLVAGERRLTASIRVGKTDIPARFIDELSEDERKIVELEENIKRQALDWRDEVRAVGNIHELYTKINPDWSVAKTGEEIGLTSNSIFRTLRVFRDLASPKLVECTSMSMAYNLLERADERKMTNVLDNIVMAGATVFAPVPPTAAHAGPAPTPKPTLPKFTFPESIIQADFLEWVKTYEGPRFNFIHCDFPYGIDVFAGPQSGRGSATIYDDSEKVYWNLIHALCTNLDKIMTPSGHLMFWLSADYHIVTNTINAFAQSAPSLKFHPKPLIWFKSDNMGILADAKRAPRHVYETCLIATREDKLLVKATSDAYHCPTDKAHHPSTKPEPMLRYFMGMFVDEGTTMFDPTCGGGSALRAAESLGAKMVIGLERDPEHFANATSALRSFRLTRALSKSAHGG